MSYKYFVKQGNLLEEDSATFIVNASNTQLRLGSGVSMAFRHHCGAQLQNEMTNKLNKLDFPLLKGDVVLTTSINATNFKYALHVAVMDYNKGIKGQETLPTLQNIEDALKNIESYIEWFANKKESQTIKLVLPLMGCGVGGLNKEEVISLYLNFFTRTFLYDCHVIIYGYDENDFNLISHIFES